jgi:hypothetical protein
VVAGGRGLYGNSMEGESGVEVRRDRTVEHNTRHRVLRRWLPREGLAEELPEEAGRRDLFGGKAQRSGARRNARRVRVRESRFMRQR